MLELLKSLLRTWNNNFASYDWKDSKWALVWVTRIRPSAAMSCLTLEVLSDAQSQPIFGPLNDARVVEDNAGQDHPLAPHHRLVCRLLREPCCQHWRGQKKEKGTSLNMYLVHILKLIYCKILPTKDRVCYLICGFMVNWWKAATPHTTTTTTLRTKGTSMIAIFDQKLARGHQLRREEHRRKQKRCQGVGEELRGRKKTKWLMLTQGEIWEIKQGNFSHSPPPPPHPHTHFSLLISSKLCGLPFLSFSLLSSFLPMSHLPGFFWQTRTTVAAIVHRCSGLQSADTDWQTDRPTDGWTDLHQSAHWLIWEKKPKTKQNKKIPLAILHAAQWRVVISRPPKTRHQHNGGFVFFFQSPFFPFCLLL